MPNRKKNEVVKQQRGLSEAGDGSAGERRKRPVDRKAEVNRAADLIYGSFGEVIGSLICSAKDGNCTAAKFLIEFAGIKMETDEKAGAPRESVGETLVRMLTARREECARRGIDAE